MKTLTLTALLLLLLAHALSAQLTIGYYQSNLPFVGVGYGLLDGRLLPEARVGTLSGLPVLLGVRAYPSAKRRLGVHLETAGLLLTDEIGDGVILRGSLGVHIRFGVA